MSVKSAHTWSPETVEARLVAIIERLAADEPALRNIFTERFDQEAMAQAGALKSGTHDGPLAGAIVTIKALLDVKGHRTTGGSHLFDEKPPAAQDAPVVARLRQAGAVFPGHTNMTELAYSGLGLNPHFGTPDNPLISDHIPGGSTSGGTVSVATGIADIAIGSDTGGSLRIPAAFTGVTGFKPSQNSVSRAGCLPLSDSLDSIGPIAGNVESCELVWSIIADRHDAPIASSTKPIIVARNFGFDDLDPAVEQGFEKALSVLSAAGLSIEERSLPSLDAYKKLAIWQFAAVECRAHYDEAYQQIPDRFDPRVLSRLKRADEASATSYRKLLNQRIQLIEQFNLELGDGFLLMPTVAIMPPSISALDDDERYYALNLLSLRNTTLGNVMDACSISLPYRHNNATIGVMLTGAGGGDRELLACARQMEKRLAGPLYASR
ncbi:MAG: amidase family protein [Stappiaceae bacterium]